MKKRKFPAGLVIALVILLGGAGAYSVYNTGVANRTPEESARIAQAQERENAPPPPAATAPTMPSKDQIRGQVAATAKGSGAPGGRTPEGPGGRPGAEAGTSILAPKSQPYKPVPNDSSTSSQWFNKR